ncbi:uncharacterized protein LOC109711491 [Ananas comosus]|uniref:Uncharacterized protein LOC109711491 n=1 Tax=Ananas comosus TaxID=4615 RepID=A0A6P5F9M0_ANACO|nr:uncharacterized protein LOC109711491 [Ananas comosus]
MDLLEMPLEAVALRFYSLPAVVAGGSIWTCLAIIAAAAIGLWRIRTVGSRSESSSSSSSSSLLTSSPPPSPSPSPNLSTPIERPILSRFELGEEVGMPKVRFTAYYNDAADCLGCCRVDDDDDDDGDGDSEEREVEADGAVSDGVNGDSQKRLSKPGWAGDVPKWEVPALSGNGDLGWYRCQDMTALNGSVVRLWDGDGGLTASPRRRGIMGIYH